MGEKQIRILLADDHVVVRMGIASIISFEPDMTVVGEAETGTEAVRLFQTLAPDVVVMDLMMPKMDGAQAVAEIRKSDPAAKVLVLTTFGASREMKRAMEAGALGAVVKTSSQAEIISAIRSVAAGHRTVSREIARALSELRDVPTLSDRQLEVLRLAAKGYSNPEIAGILSLGVDAVKDHLGHIYELLGVSSRTEAATYAAVNHLI